MRCHLLLARLTGWAVGWTHTMTGQQILAAARAGITATATKTTMMIQCASRLREAHSLTRHMKSATRLIELTCLVQDQDRVDDDFFRQSDESGMHAIMD